MLLFYSGSELRITNRTKYVAKLYHQIIIMYDMYDIALCLIYLNDSYIWCIFMYTYLYDISIGINDAIYDT